MVLMLVIPIRAVFHLENVITERHLDNLGKMLLAMGLLLAYSYVMETFIGWYSGDVAERYTYLTERPTGPYALLYWIMTACNVVAPQALWFRRCRRSIPVLLAVSAAVLVGMWLERFVIIVSSLNRDFLPSSWHYYAPTWVDFGVLAGSVGLFGLLFLLFVRFVPSIAMSEVKEQHAERRHSEAHHG
jgi:molybdopterin-containing oxidoreductase family membrane subunit